MHRARTSALPTPLLPVPVSSLPCAELKVWVSLDGHPTKVRCAADADVDDLLDAIKTKLELTQLAIHITLLNAGGTATRPGEFVSVVLAAGCGTTDGTAIVVQLQA
jgi:hypothetical protein